MNNIEKMESILNIDKNVTRLINNQYKLIKENGIFNQPNIHGHVIAGFCRELENISDVLTNYNREIIEIEDDNGVVVQKYVVYTSSMYGKSTAKHTDDILHHTSIICFSNEMPESIQQKYINRHMEDNQSKVTIAVVDTHWNFYTADEHFVVRF